MMQVNCPNRNNTIIFPYIDFMCVCMQKAIFMFTRLLTQFSACRLSIMHQVHVASIFRKTGSHEPAIYYTWLNRKADPFPPFWN